MTERLTSERPRKAGCAWRAEIGVVEIEDEAVIATGLLDRAEEGNVEHVPDIG